MDLKVRDKDLASFYIWKPSFPSTSLKIVTFLYLALCQKPWDLAVCVYVRGFVCLFLVSLICISIFVLAPSFFVCLFST